MRTQQCEQNAVFFCVKRNLSSHPARANSKSEEGKTSTYRWHNVECCTVRTQIKNDSPTFQPGSLGTVVSRRWHLWNGRHHLFINDRPLIHLTVFNFSCTNGTGIMCDCFIYCTASYSTVRSRKFSQLLRKLMLKFCIPANQIHEAIIRQQFLKTAK